MVLPDYGLCCINQIVTSLAPIRLNSVSRYGACRRFIINSCDILANTMNNKLTYSLSILAVLAFVLGFVSPALANSSTPKPGETQQGSSQPTPVYVYMDGCDATTPVSKTTGKPCELPQFINPANPGQIIPLDPGCDSWVGVSKISGKPCKPTMPVPGTTTPPTATTTINNYGCTTTTIVSPVNGQPCSQLVPGYIVYPNQNGSDVVAPRPSNPQIAYWWGKVNQHVGSQGDWQTDKDGVSGANIDPLSYCKKFYPETKYITAGTPVKITDWRDRGNLSSYVGTSTPYNCVQDKKIENSNGQATTTPPVKNDCPTTGCIDDQQDQDDQGSTTEPADDANSNQDDANNYIKDNGCNATTIYSLTTGEPCNPDVQPVINNGKNNKQTVILKINAVQKMFVSLFAKIF